MKSFNRHTGAVGENLAEKELTKKGFEILERNFSNRYGEIDIIAKDKDTLVFVEVKAKKGLEFGRPEEMITRNKLQKIQHMATVYMNGQIVPCRIDVVAIVLSSSDQMLSCHHYENVYLS